MTQKGLMEYDLIKISKLSEKLERTRDTHSLHLNRFLSRNNLIGYSGLRLKPS